MYDILYVLGKFFDLESHIYSIRFYRIDDNNAEFYFVTKKLEKRIRKEFGKSTTKIPKSEIVGFLETKNPTPSLQLCTTIIHRCMSEDEKNKIFWNYQEVEINHKLRHRIIRK